MLYFPSTETVDTKPIYIRNEQQYFSGLREVREHKPDEE